MSVFSKIYEKQVKQIKFDEGVRQLTNTKYIWNMFTSTIINTWKWGGHIPDFIKTNPQYIEESLFYSPFIAYFVGDNGEHLIAPAFPNGVLLENGLYSKYTMIMRNGKTYIRGIEDIELCLNNSLDLPTIELISEIANKCISALNAVEVQLNRVCFPKIFNVKDEDDIVKITDIITKARNNNHLLALISSKSYGNDSIEKYDVFDNRSDSIRDVWDTFVNLKNLGLSMIGIQNIDIQKKERLTEAESEAQNELTRFSLMNDMTICRDNWIERVKNHFGANLSYELSRSSETVYENLIDNETKKGAMTDDFTRNN